MANIAHDARVVDVHVQPVRLVVHGLHAVGLQHAVLRRQVRFGERRAAVRVRERLAEQFVLPVVVVGPARGGAVGYGVLWVGNGKRGVEW